MFITTLLMITEAISSRADVFSSRAEDSGVPFIRETQGRQMSHQEATAFVKAAGEAWVGPREATHVQRQLLMSSSDLQCCS